MMGNGSTVLTPPPTPLLLQPFRVKPSLVKQCLPEVKISISHR